MRFLCLSDTHLQASPPEFRVDDYLETQFNKWAQVFRIARQERVDYILHGGDVYQVGLMTTPYHLTARLLHLLVNNQIPILGVPGQHDYRYHSTDIDNTPINVLFSSGAFTRLGADPFFASDSVHIYGAAFYEDVPIVEDPEVCNILVTHRMVTGDKKLWEAQAEFEWGNILLGKHPYWLIVSGDNHQTFVCQDGRGYLINPGSMMRRKTDQRDHKPSVFIADSEANMVKQFFLKIKPAELVFDLERKRIQDEKKKERSVFVNSLKDSKERKIIDYLEKLKERMEKKEVPESTRTYMNGVISHVLDTTGTVK